MRRDLRLQPAKSRVSQGGYNINPKALRTHIVRLLGPKTILYKAVGPV